MILAGSTVGLLAATLGRLYSSVFYALRDTRTPLRFAILRVALTAGLALFAVVAPLYVSGRYLLASLAGLALMGLIVGYLARLVGRR